MKDIFITNLVIDRPTALWVMERDLEVEKAVRKKLTAKAVEGLKIPFEFD